MTKNNRFLRISAAIIAGFYTLLIFHPSTANLVLCCQTDGSMQLELASMNYSCICSHSHDRDRRDQKCALHDRCQHDRGNGTELTETYAFCHDIPVTSSAFVTDIPSPPVRPTSPDASPAYGPTGDHSHPPITSTQGIRKLPRAAIYKSLFSILC